MCLEVTNARKTNMDHARAAARAAEKVSADVQDGVEWERDNQNQASSELIAPSADRSVKGAVAGKGGSGKAATRELSAPRVPPKATRPSPAPEAVPRGRGTAKLETTPAPTPKRLTPKQRRQRRALLTGTVAAVLGGFGWFLLAGSAEPGEPNEEMVMELRQRMGLVKSAVLAVQERSGALPESVALVEEELKRREFDPNALSPPLRIVLNRKTTWPYAVVMRTRPKGLALTATDGKGREVLVNGQPLLMEVLRGEGATQRGGARPGLVPTPRPPDVRLDGPER
jgi:hypothetical protein